MTYLEGHNRGEWAIGEWAIEERQRLKKKKLKQKAEKPNDVASQIIIGSKMKLLQQVIDKWGN